MGPRLVSRGKAEEVGGGHAPREASMGPRLVSCGKVRRCWRPRAKAASMGPRLVSRGKARTARTCPLIASMGPRLVSRGKARMTNAQDILTELQWGRGW